MELKTFDELVLLTITDLNEQAYGVSIKKAMEQQLNASLSIGSIQSALKQLEAKGLLLSKYGEPTSRRGGRRKRMYDVTSYANRILNEIKAKTSLWEDSTKTGVNFQSV
ncbi:MAG: helix-turn-helix transcriptional regulator [Cyclobacteriaceae bacterium]